MTFASAIALFAAMTVLAAIPSVSVMTVTSRAAALGFNHGVWAAVGIVVGDLLYMVLAMGGLALLAALMSNWLWLLKYLAATYLILVGLRVLLHPVAKPSTVEPSGGACWTSALTGLMVTVGDQKAVFFYLAFLPAFLDLDSFAWWDVLAVAVITVIAVGGVKLLYAWLGARVGLIAGRRGASLLNKVGGSIMVGAGLWLLGRRPDGVL